MEKRTVTANKIYLNALTYSAIFNIGDTRYARPHSNGIAVQKEGAAFHEDDGIFFKDYSLFRRKANWSTGTVPIKKNTFHHRDTIQVGNVRITGVSQTAMFQVGSIDKVDSEARIKHLRRYLNA